MFLKRHLAVQSQTLYNNASEETKGIFSAKIQMFETTVDALQLSMNRTSES